MLKKELKTHLLILLGWLVMITLLRWSWHWNLLWLWLGGGVGTFLIDLDHFIYLFLINPHELTSQRAQRLWSQRKTKELLSLVVDTVAERTKLAFHNALFQVILFVLCFFVLSSSGNLFGAGLVMAMALHLLKDEFLEWRAGQEERLKEWLFWPVKLEINLEQQKFFLILMLFAFLGLNLFLL
ncbi:hypothetical protein FJZ41_02260 [Candidatus Shapirobacteria bacterium]|nr:hypothetical protein [Candidatus Shapirobacteria bacterium]